MHSAMVMCIAKSGCMCITVPACIEELVGKIELTLVRNIKVVKEHKICCSEVFENGQVFDIKMWEGHVRSVMTDEFINVFCCIRKVARALKKEVPTFSFVPFPQVLR